MFFPVKPGHTSYSEAAFPPLSVERAAEEEDRNLTGLFKKGVSKKWQFINFLWV